MKNSPKWLFVVACVLALAAVVQNFRFDASTRSRQAAARVVERDVALLRLTLAEFRGAQAAYLATGQGPDFWLGRVAELASRLEEGVGTLRPLLRDEAALAQLTNASTALADLFGHDKRARQALSGNQRFLASDIVFAESLAATQSFIDALANTAAAETTVLDGLATRDSRLQLAMMAGALLLTIVAGLVWVQTKPAPPVTPAAGVAQMLRDLPPPVRSPLPQPVAAAPPKPVPAPTSPRPFDLTEAAEVCVDLARVMDSRDIPTLLGRAAHALDASGVVIWAATTDGLTLVPALTHGYSTRVVSRLGALDVSGDNITSACFRSMRPQTMAGVGYPGATSAVAVPLITADGCNGVLSAELAVSKPPAENLALARIIAAQFATMITPAEPSAAQSPDTSEPPIQAAEG